MISSNNAVTVTIDNLVHKTGNESISGVKTFNNDVSLSNKVFLSWNAYTNALDFNFT